MTLLAASGLPYSILSLCDMVLRNMSRPTVEAWLIIAFHFIQEGCAFAGLISATVTVPDISYIII